MFFMIVMQWIRNWYDQIFFPIVSHHYFYLLVSVWLLLMSFMTYLFFYKIDVARFRYIKKNLIIELVKSMLFGLFMATMLLALYELSLMFTMSSDVFKHQQQAWFYLTVVGLLRFGNLFLIFFYKVVTVLFLVCSSMFSIYFLSCMTYHLEDTKTCWVYMFFTSLIAIGCYLFFMLLGYL